MANQFSPSEEVTSDDKLWALLAYIIGIIVPVIILVMEDKKSRRFLRYHAIQALASQIVLSIIAAVTCGFGSVVFLVEIYFAIKAYQGEYFEIPLITDFIKKQGWVS
jgi:uncharacterized membrane protein